jgi:hypothetical protein
MNIVEIATDLQQLAAERRLLPGDGNCTELDIIARALRVYRIWYKLDEIDREYLSECTEIGERSPFTVMRKETMEAEKIVLAAYEQVTNYGTNYRGFVKDHACKVCIGEDEAAKLPEHMKDFICWYHKAEALVPKEA